MLGTTFHFFSPVFRVILKMKMQHFKNDQYLWTKMDQVGPGRTKLKFTGKFTKSPASLLCKKKKKKPQCFFFPVHAHSVFPDAAGFRFTEERNSS